MNPYAELMKERLDLRAVMEYYGLEFNRAGFAICPFHAEDTASLSIRNGRFKCFGCGEYGDVIKFVQKHFDLSFPQAMMKLDKDFQLGLFCVRPTRSAVSEIAEKRRKEREALAEYQSTYRKKEAVFRVLWHAYIHFKPQSPDEPIHGLYETACKELPYYEDWFENHPWKGKSNEQD